MMVYMLIRLLLYKKMVRATTQCWMVTFLFLCCAEETSVRAGLPISSIRNIHSLINLVSSGAGSVCTVIYGPAAREDIYCQIYRLFKTK